MTKKAS